MEKRTKARGPGGTQGKKDQLDPCCGMQHQRVDARHGEDDSEVKVRNGSVSNCRTELRNAHSQNASRGRRQGRPWFPRDASSGSPSSGGREFWLRKQSGFPSVEHDWRIQGEQQICVGRKRSEGEGQLTNLQGWKDKRYCDLPFMMVGCSYLLPIRLGWSTLDALHIQVVARVPRKPCQEFRQGCYPDQHSTDVGWALWCVDNVWCP